MFRNRLLALCLLLAAMVAPKCFAHPMGNFSVNHYSKISLENDGIKVTYIIDLAEIPTYQELQQGNITATVVDPAVTRFVASRGAAFGQGLSLLIGGKPVALELTVQPGDLSSRRRRPAYHEDGLCLPGGVSVRSGPLNRQPAVCRQ